jgi:transposase
VTPQIVRDWVMQYNEEESDGLVNRKAPGPVSRLIDAQRRALAKRMEAGPDRPSTAW